MTNKSTEFKRIFHPRTDKAVKAIMLLTNGVRYKPTEAEIATTLTVLKDAVNDIAQLYGVLPGGEVVVKEVPLTATEASEKRIEDKIAVNKKSPFARGDVDANVRSVPENQLTAYATHILARICNKFDLPEAKPKNYEVKVPG